MKRSFKKGWRLLAGFAILFGLATTIPTHQVSQAGGNQATTTAVASRVKGFFSRGSSARGNGSMVAPTQEQATAVLSPAVRQQIGGPLRWNGHGAFIVNNDQPTLNAQINSAPYAVDRLDRAGRAWQGDAWLNRTTRQYQNRSATGNGATNWKPAGFLQAKNLTGGPTHAYDRGHLLGYALVGGLRGFDASESNPQNIATQTAWANEARTTTSTGQNYYEGLVRKALDQGKQVRYRVTDVYDGSNLVPAGAHIEALSKDGSLSFNVFVPNVQNNIVINYATGAVTRR